MSQNKWSLSATLILTTSFIFLCLYLLNDVESNSHSERTVLGPKYDVVLIVAIPPDLVQYEIWQKWFKKELHRHEYIPELNSIYRTDYTRFYQRSLWQNFPWLGTLHLVVPSDMYESFRGAHKHPDVNFVKHEQLLSNSSLPTFNWRSLATSVDLIPNLTEDFVILHEGVFILNSSPNLLYDDTGIRQFYIEHRESEASEREELNIIQHSKSVVAEKIRPGDELFLKFVMDHKLESKLPNLVNKRIFQDMKHLISEDNQTQYHRFRAKTSIDILQSYQIYVLSKLLDIPNEIHKYDTNDDGIIDKLEGRNLSYFLNTSILPLKASVIQKTILDKSYLDYKSNSILSSPFISIETYQYRETLSMLSYAKENNLSLHLGNKIMNEGSSTLKTMIEDHLKSALPRSCLLEEDLRNDSLLVGHTFTLLTILTTIVFIFLISHLGKNFKNIHRE